MNDSKLYSLARNLVEKLLPLIKDVIAKGRSLRTIRDYPKLEILNNGMPNLSRYGEGPIDIYNLLRYEEILGGEIENLYEYRSLRDYFLNLKQFKEYFLIEDKDEYENYYGFFEFMAKSYSIEFVAKYYYLFGDSFLERNFIKIYEPLENLIFTDTLYFDIGVPILFMHFDFEEFQVNENTFIRRISEKSHLSRFRIKRYSPAIAEAVLSSATHEIVFKNYSRQKPDKWLQNKFDKEELYPMHLFDNFFSAIKISSNVNIGYAQILIYPINWSEPLYADLPLIEGTSVRKYPSVFDDFFWNRTDLPVVNIEEIELIKDIYQRIIESQDDKILIASKRLRNSCLRDNEEDSILDIIIALETLLSGSEKVELSHKLSLRIAKLFSLYVGDEDPFNAFSMVKKIYDYRSAIVHGNPKVNKKREIRFLGEEKTIETIALANNYLRKVLKILLDNPQYLNPAEIDKKMISN